MPVGEDQRQHLELTRNLAQRFNHRVRRDVHGAGAVHPQGRPRRSRPAGSDPQDVEVVVLPDGIIELLEDPARSAKKIRSAVTDTEREIVFDRERKPGISNLLTIYSALTGRSLAELTEAYRGKGYGDLKKDLAEVVVEFLRPIRERTQTYLDDPAQLDKVLRTGAEKAREVASATLRDVYERVGFLPYPAHA